MFMSDDLPEDEEDLKLNYYNYELLFKGAGIRYRGVKPEIVKVLKNYVDMIGEILIV